MTAPLRFVASSGMPGPESDGRPAVRVENIDTAAFMRNPVVLWNHGVSRLPIGRADVWLDGGRLLADIVFDPADRFAQRVRQKYADGYLHAVSVGLKRGREFAVDSDGNFDPARQTWVLEEISACVLPGDAFAVIVRPSSNGHAASGSGPPSHSADGRRGGRLPHPLRGGVR